MSAFNFFIVCVSLCTCFTDGVRVCPTFDSYNRIFSPSCYNSPVSEQNITEIIQSWGYTAEEHYITTDDGYILLLERAYHKISIKKSPILIVHGIFTNGIGFVYQGTASMVYTLGKQGYDVWILSYRGTVYSKGHVNKSLNPRNPKFWSYSINELGTRDIRTALKYVNEKTEKKALYIGYSMGTTGFFIYSTTFPEEAKSYVKGMVGVAPVINYKATKSLGKLTADPIFWPILKFLIYKFWQGEVFPGISVVLKPFITTSLGMLLVQFGLNLIFGDDYEQMSPLLYPLIPSWLDTTGAEVYAHYVQIYQSGRFQNYDYGTSGNLKKYGQSVPPRYNLSKVSMPVALIVAPNDWLATSTNAEQLYSELPPSYKCGYHVINFSKWNHMDFIAAKDLDKYFHRHLLNKLEELDMKLCDTTLQ